MDAIILGGCADMAVPLKRWLAADGEVRSVTLADIDEAKARKQAAELGPKFQAAFFDAENPAGAAELMRGKDVALSFVGPFYRFEEPMARAAIEAGTDYVSICDDYDAFLKVRELDARAREAGVRVLTGFGNSPGLTQILARKGRERLGGAEAIDVYWCAGSAEAAGPSNLAHLFHIFNGTTLQTVDGKEVRVKTGTSKRVVEFPSPIGKAAVYFTGHAESVSLPRTFPDLKRASLRGGVKPGYIVGLVKAMSALGLLATHKRRMALARFFHRVEGAFAGPGMDKSVGRVEVFAANGRLTWFTYVGHIAELTSAPAYVAAKRLASGKFEGVPGGVYSAERLLEDPDPFLAELRALGVEIGDEELAG